MVLTPTWLTPDRAAGDLEGQVYRGLRERILLGLLSSPQRLPSTRAMASSLGGSPEIRYQSLVSFVGSDLRRYGRDWT